MTENQTVKWVRVPVWVSAASAISGSGGGPVGLTTN